LQTQRTELYNCRGPNDSHVEMEKLLRNKIKNKIKNEIKE
jgi:hypothetical protein